MFNISDKVVCIDDNLGAVEEYFYPNGYVVKDQIYCIESIVEFPYRGKLTLSFFITGLPAIYKINNQSSPWVAERFRKLEDIKEENRLKNACKNPNKEYIKR